MGTAGRGCKEGQLGEFLECMDRLRKYERSGVPRGAGTDSGDVFDLGRMRRLLRRLGDPHTHYPSVHIVGTKGKGSTVVFLSKEHGGPVLAVLLSDLFRQAKEAIDESIESENGALTHFEVFTAL